MSVIELNKKRGKKKIG